MPVLPDKARDLDVSGNELTSLLGIPLELRCLRAFNNPITTLPTTVLELPEETIVQMDDCLSQEGLDELSRAMRKGRVGPKIKFYERGLNTFSTRG